MRILGVGALALTLASCQKEDAALSNLDSYDEVISSEMEEQDVQENEVVGAHQNCEGSGFDKDLPDCATVTESGDSYPKTITIDYGDGCETDQGKTKKGIVLIVQSNEMMNTGATRTITFTGLSVGNVSMTGKRTVINQGVNEDGNIVFSVEGEMTGTKDGKSKKRVFTHQREWIAGQATCDKSDDEFLITGSATMSCTKKSMTREITEPLHIAPGTCKYPKSGVIVMSGGKRDGSINFGDGTCDNVAILTTSKGEVKEIDLDERKSKR